MNHWAILIWSDPIGMSIRFFYLGKIDSIPSIIQSINFMIFFVCNFFDDNSSTIPLRNEPSI